MLKANVYVISPNVWKDGNQNIFIDYMFENKVILMGWDKDKPKGAEFNNIKIGDIVIVAQGANSNKRLYFVGVIASASTKIQTPIGEVAQARKLNMFVDIRKKRLSFSTDCAYGASNQIPSIYKLKTANEADNDVIKEVLEIIEKEKKSQEMKKMIDLLSKKKNIILQGAPGTGKTYTTAVLALQTLGVNNINYSDHNEVMRKYKELQGTSIFFTTFHQSLDYEDFIEGLKPCIQEEDGKTIGITYEPHDGIFKMACRAAQADDSINLIERIDEYLTQITGYENRRTIPTLSGKSSLYVWRKEGSSTISTRSTTSKSSKEEDYSPSPLNILKVKAQAEGKGAENNWTQYAQAFINAVIKEYNISNDRPAVLIIDEINRGNISKIFGELITLIEADKRLQGEHPIEVELPYSHTLFGVPSNLYIIGTMNTTDRSTGTIDYALRRRFGFYTIKSDRNLISLPLAQTLFDKVSAFIDDNKQEDEDLEDLMIGHSYFMKANNNNDLSTITEYEIIPLIKEYIKDGILLVRPSIAKETFLEWKNLCSDSSENLNNAD